MLDPSVVTAHQDTTHAEVARTILQHHIGGVPVVHVQGKLSGTITVSDFAAEEQGISCSTFRTPQVLPCLLRTLQESKP